MIIVFLGTMVSTNAQTIFNEETNSILEYVGDIDQNTSKYLNIRNTDRYEWEMIELIQHLKASIETKIIKKNGKTLKIRKRTVEEYKEEEVTPYIKALEKYAHIYKEYLAMKNAHAKAEKEFKEQNKVDINEILTNI